MKNLVIVGAGTGGTIIANRMRRRLEGWKITAIDPSPTHLYQPGLLFLPFGAHDEAAMLRPRARTLHSGIELVNRAVDALDLDGRSVRLVGGEEIPYDLLVLASGVRLRFDLTAGLSEARGAGIVDDFYTLEGAQALRAKLEKFEGGRLVLNVVEMPIKCPVAPLEFLFLADAFFRRKGLREKVELVYATPLDAAFTRPIAARHLGGMLESKHIHFETDFGAAEVDPAKKILRSYDDREVPFDLLVSIPTHSGAQFVEATGLGNELAFVATDKHTLQVKGHPEVFALGDATDLPASKAGSVAHFQAEILQENLLSAIRGEPLRARFDGHTNCFIESGDERALLIDFNYDTEPMPGRFPTAVGPFSLMHESRVNHLGKLGFRWMYWHGLLPGHFIPIPAHMPTAGKPRPTAAAPLAT